MYNRTGCGQNSLVESHSCISLIGFRCQLSRPFVRLWVGWWVAQLIAYKRFILNTYSVASAFHLLICAHHTGLCNINHSFPGLMVQKQETNIQINIKKFQVKPSFQSNDYQLNIYRNCVYCLFYISYILIFLILTFILILWV